MKFIYAKELNQMFDVTGHFYNLKLSGSVFKCRSVLEIRRKNSGEENVLPDIVVIMMNPGSSRPIDKNFKINTFSKKEYLSIKVRDVVPTRPDNAQYQIMRLMIFNKWSFVRVLNLSDLRNGNSGKFKTEFINAMKLDKTNPHCLTHKDRSKELINFLKSKNGKIIAAWGSISELKIPAENILKLNKNIIGIINGNVPNYRYASPYLKSQKTEWLKEIQKKL
ncbi:MAG TPA: hypothetical protein PLD63_04700 [Ignavibacteria bacterium]|nr:hypothetical protein [Ignavibacteria bacterium]